MSRAAVKAALQRMRGGVGFGEYVNTLKSAKDDVISMLIARNTPASQREELIAEARVYDDLLSDINKNT